MSLCIVFVVLMAVNPGITGVNLLQAKSGAITFNCVLSL